MKRMFSIGLMGILFMISFTSATIAHIEQSETPIDVLRSLEQELTHSDFKDLLSHDLSSITRLLEYGKKTHQPQTYARSIFKFFGNKIKGTDYLEADELSRVLKGIPSLLHPYFVPYKANGVLRNMNLLEMDAVDRLQETVSAVLYTRFENNYDQFEHDPESFLDSLSLQILSAAQEEMNIEQLRQTIIRFLEVCLSKVTWCAQDHVQTWESVKSLSHNLANLFEYNILNDTNDLDDLFWTLIHRYCLFLDLTATDLPIEFYDCVKNEIATQQLLLLEIEEQDSFIQTKQDHLWRSIITSEARKRAADL